MLTYYKSQDEVNQGCKGSIKVQACEINGIYYNCVYLKYYINVKFVVNSIDMTRMDLVIPGEQHMYLRASTSQERQKWLVALGTAKACVQNKNRKESSKLI